MNLQECLPASMRGSDTIITKVAAGLSGAGVHRVDVGGASYVLKVASEDVPRTSWRRKVHVQELAGEAGVAPRVVHVDEERRAVVSVLVADRAFPSYYYDPRTRDAAIATLGRLLRRVHDIPLPPDAEGRRPREFLAGVSQEMLAGVALPAFVRDAVRHVLAEEPPESGRALVLSHNDLNPSNIVWDGERLWLLDWDTAGPNDPLFDLAVASIFLRMDEATCRALLAAHDDARVDVLPPRFAYDRRIAGVMCGAMFVGLASRSGHPGTDGTETLATAPSLADIYGRMRAGTVNIATPDGQWQFGLALVKAGLGD